MLIRKHDEVCKGYPNAGQKPTLMYGGLRNFEKRVPCCMEISPIKLPCSAAHDAPQYRVDNPPPGGYMPE